MHCVYIDSYEELTLAAQSAALYYERRIERVVLGAGLLLPAPIAEGGWLVQKFTDPAAVDAAVAVFKEWHISPYVYVNPPAFDTVADGTAVPHNMTAYHVYRWLRQAGQGFSGVYLDDGEFDTFGPRFVAQARALYQGVIVNLSEWAAGNLLDYPSWAIGRSNAAVIGLVPLPTLGDGFLDQDYLRWICQRGIRPWFIALSHLAEPQVAAGVAKLTTAGFSVWIPPRFAESIIVPEET